MIRIINNHKKEWITLIHCVCGTEKIFKYQMEALSKKYNIIIVRLAGHEIESEINEAKIGFVVQELYEFLDENKIDKTDILGLSLGSMIGTEFVLRYPKKVNKAYLIGCLFGFYIPFFKTGYMTLMKIKRFVLRKLYMYFIIFAILPSKNEKEQRKKFFDFSMKVEKQVLYAWMEEMGRFIVKGKEKMRAVNNSSVNIKYIYGKKDIIFSKYAKRYIDEDKLVIIEKAGHLANLVAPEEVNKMIVGD